LLGANDFSIEAWVYPSSQTNQMVMNGQTDRATAAGSSYSFNVGPSATPAVYIGGSGYAITGANPVANAWSHVVFCRTGGTLSTYLNGVRIGTRSDLSTGAVNNGSTTYAPAIGANGGGVDLFTGYLADVKRIIGSGGYNATSSTITVPTAPLTATTNTNLLLSYTNAGILDNSMLNNLETVGNAAVSTSVKKYGAASMYFDGTGDWLSARYNDPTMFLGSSNWTIECWVYLNSTSGTQGIIFGQSDFAVAANASYELYATGASALFFSGSSNYSVTVPSITVSTWTHLAWVRNGTVITLYVNGTSSASVTIGTGAINNGTTYPTTIGAKATGGNALNGYIDDLRITKAARYTTTFTVPDQAFPNG
jgi:hypothetical protein